MRIALIYMAISLALSQAQDPQDSLLANPQNHATLTKKLENLMIIEDPTFYIDPWDLDEKPKLIGTLDLPRIFPDKNYFLVIRMLIDIDGTVIDSDILRTSGNVKLDSIVLEAARDVRFTPARYKGHFVQTRVSMPISFRILK